MQKHTPLLLFLVIISGLFWLEYKLWQHDHTRQQIVERIEK